MVYRALENIAAWFTDHYEKQGLRKRMFNMHKHQEEMTQLEEALETAFEYFKVR
jgi:hypothetical protein